MFRKNTAIDYVNYVTKVLDQRLFMIQKLYPEKDPSLSTNVHQISNFQDLNMAFLE